MTGAITLWYIGRYTKGIGYLGSLSQLSLFWTDLEIAQNKI